MSERFLIFGHRGSPKRFPENTLASFEEALRAGADGFETDLRVLSDRSVILFHDDEIGDAGIESLSLAQCAARGATPVRLADLGAFANRAVMILEIKRRGWEELLFEQVGEWPRVVVASFDHSVVARLRALGAAFPLGITVSGRLIDTAGYAARIGASWCFPNHRFVDRELVGSLHERGIRVVAWTANRREDWDRLRAAGCDGVITDVPGEAVAWSRGPVLGD